MTEAAIKEKKPGQTVNVRHRSKGNRSGASELMACSQRDSRVEVITAVYMDGKVRVQSGDVWQVKPSSGRTDWVTDEVVGSKGVRLSDPEDEEEPREVKAKRRRKSVEQSGESLEQKEG